MENGGRGCSNPLLHDGMHRCPKAKLVWWKDWWQCVLVVAMVCPVEKEWLSCCFELVLGGMMGIFWQCGLESYRSSSDQGMVLVKARVLVGVGS